MTVNYADHVKQLLAANPTIDKAAVVTLDGKVLFQTKNWDVTNDIKKLLADWQAMVAFVVLCDIRYSILQCTPERLVSTNVGKKGHLVGATMPEGHLFLTHTTPDGNYQASYMDTARAAAQMKPGGEAPKGSSKSVAKASMGLESSPVKVPFAQTEGKKSAQKKGTEKAPEPRAKGTGQGKSDGLGTSLIESLLSAKREKSPEEASPAGITPALYQDIKNFLTWIYDPVGLAAFIDYAMWQNDQEKLIKLANLYHKIGQVFNFPT